MDQTLRTLIIQHEGCKLKPYKDTMGYLTVGVGRNLDTNGIRMSEALQMLDNDLMNCEMSLKSLPWYADMDTVRQGVIIELTFNIGIGKVLQFKDMIAALTDKDYDRAADELLDSTWAKQVGATRSGNMSSRLRNGAY